MKRLNKRLMASQLSEAKEQLMKIEDLLNSGKRLSEDNLIVPFEHLYHHINFAWNARFATASQYRHLSDSNFNRWSKFPHKLWEFQITKKK